MNTLRTASIVIFLLNFAIPSKAQDQTPTQGKITIAAGLGFGIHGVNSNDSKAKNDGTVTGNLRAAVDYGITKRLAVGLQLFRNGYATDRDSNNSANNSGIGAYVNYNFALRPKTVWFFTGGLGYSGFNYADYSNNGKVSASGAYGSLGLGFRRFFGDYFGIFMQLEGTSYAFRNFEYKDGTSLKTYDAKDYRINITGVELKTGLLLRL